MVLCFSNAFAGNNNHFLGNPPELELDKQISISGKCAENVAYFKLLMLNESKDGVYSMVKEFDDGTKVSVGTRLINANTIDSPLMYSFVDRDLPEEDANYILYRITDETVVVKSWKYCSDEKELCINGLIANE